MAVDQAMIGARKRVPILKQIRENRVLQGLTRVNRIPEAASAPMFGDFPWNRSEP